MFDEQKDKEKLRDALKEGVVLVTFTKKDGEERTIFATLSPDYLPPKPEPKEGQEAKPARTPSETACPVYDMNKRAWRSFRWDSIKRVVYQEWSSE